MGGTTRTRQSQERTYGGQEHEERVTERRDKLIETGIRLFGTQGYHGTTVRTLIAESGLATRYFYESFATLESLLIACYEHLMEQYRQKLDTVLSVQYPSLEDAARAGLRCFFQFMRDPKSARITQIEILGVSPAVDQMYYKATRRFGSLIIGTVTSFGEMKPLPKADADLLGLTLAGAVSIAGTHWARSGYKHSMERMVESTLLIVVGTASQLIK